MDRKQMLSIGLFIILVVSILGFTKEVMKGINEINQFRELSESVKSNLSDEETVINLLEIDTVTTEETINQLEVLQEYQELYEENKDLAGWITIEETQLNYPVMFTPNNPEFYLHRAFDGSRSTSGVPFIGKGCGLVPRTDNIIIYGHNMKNGTMFSRLLSYKDEKFWEQHSTIQFNTLYETATYIILAAFNIDVTLDNGHFEFYNSTDFETEEEYTTFVKECKQQSIYDTGLTAEKGDFLITLVTCSYHSQNGRFVVVAKKLDINEQH
ncbi:class B sortase [Anaerotignum sp.]|uniref:class B sortase n=1 Tax=Anaerotignum sp. TaxID=2039241 RepID=UPI0028A93D40|nr:class B sortase [Anaerotignum sp.]